MFESWPGEKLLIKVLETIDKGASGALSPWQIRREARARAEARRDELLLLAQAESDVAKIRAGEAVLSADGRLLPPPGKRAQLVEGSVEAEVQKAPALPLYLIWRQQQQDNTTTELQRAINLRKIAIFAEEEAEEHKNELVSDEPVNPDWFARWRDHAEDVSDEDMQRLWARVLTGEAQQTNGYSLHALELLSRMSKTDAELVAKLAHLDIGGGIIARIEGDYYAQIDLPFDKLIYLDDIGILNGVIGIGGLSKVFVPLEFNPKRDGEVLFAIPVKQYVVVFVFPRAKIKQLEISAYTISHPAKQLLRLVVPNVDINYLYEIAKMVKKFGYSSAKYGPLVYIDQEREKYNFQINSLIELDV